MAEQFYTILTNAGKAAIANASALGTKVDFKTMRLGDGNGNYYNPTEQQTQLVNEVYSSQINHVQIDKTNPNWVALTMVLAANVGGFTVREVGAFDTEGNLLVIGKYPETYKPLLEDGSAKDLTINLILEVSNASVVTLKIDPTVMLATKAELDILRQQLIDYKDELDAHKAEDATTAKKGHVQLTTSTSSTSTSLVPTASALKSVNDSINSQTVNEITAMLVTDLPSAYPRGVTAFQLITTTSAPWRDAVGNVGQTTNYAVVETIKMRTYSVQRITFIYIDDGTTKGTWQREGSSTGAWRSWKKVTPNISYGTVAPTGGVDGDIYFQYE